MARFDYGTSEFADLSFAAESHDALYELGLMYCAGRDVEPDLVAAHKWFNLAALKGNIDARVRRQELAGEMSREQVAEAQRMAREWLTAH